MGLGVYRRVGQGGDYIRRGRMRLGVYRRVGQGGFTLGGAAWGWASTEELTKEGLH